MIGARWGLLAVVVTLAGCRPPDSGDGAAAAAVLAADSAWAAAFARKDLAGYLSFVDSSAEIQQANAPPVRGLAAIRAMIEGFLALDSLSGTWHPATVTVARSGDLAFTTGSYELRYREPSGRPALERGKYLEVWRRQADGRWKMIVESFNSDQPAAAAP